jgi:hypothetical protein
VENRIEVEERGRHLIGRRAQHEFDHVRGRGDAHSVVLPQEPMAAGRGAARDRAGHGTERAAERGGMTGRVQ